MCACHVSDINKSEAPVREFLSENQVSSTAAPGSNGFPLNITAVMEGVKITRLMEGNLAQDLRTLMVPFTTGSIISAFNIIYYHNFRCSVFLGLAFFSLFKSSCQ